MIPGNSFRKRQNRKTLPVERRNWAKLETTTLIGICLITFICFKNTLTNQFLFWDDNQFILNNIYIRRFSLENIKYLFLHEFAANFQPLTMLSYSLNYLFSQYSPFGYFFTNVLLHLANTALIFLLIQKILITFCSNQTKQSTILIAAFASLLFGIHPMHVESVNWLFERKDVLYTFFYLAGLVTYIRYLEKKKTVWLVYVFLLFICSALSKPMAVVFPLSLFLIDYIIGRKFQRGVWLEKIPFVVFSFIVGFLTLHTQKEAHAFIYSFSLNDRICIASYSFVEYIFKLFSPIHLSGFYPYPVNLGEPLPQYFHLFPLLLVILLTVPLYFTFKKNKIWFKILVFGLGFYIVNIFLVLQFLSVGTAIISDRYSYISYIGLFFIIAFFLNELFQRGKTLTKNVVIIIVIVSSTLLGYLCYVRTLVWQNTETMLTDITNQYPEEVPQAYKYLGIYYGENGRPQDAFKCYDILINKMHLKDADAYCNMGSVFISLNNFKEAAKYLTKSLQIDSNLFMPYYNLGIICADTGNYAAAFQYYEKAKSIYPNDENLYFNISLAHVATKQYAEAINDYNILLHMNPDNALYYFNRGIAEYSIGNIDRATEDFVKTLAIPVTQKNKQYHLDANAANNLSVIYKSKGDSIKALAYSKEAYVLGYQK